MSRATAFVAVVACTSALLAGCADAPVRLGAPSTAAPPAGPSREVSGSACGLQLLWVIPVQSLGRYDRAYHEILEKAGEDYVADVQVQEAWYWAAVGTIYCTNLRARAVRGGAAPAPRAPGAPTAPGGQSPSVPTGPAVPTATLGPGAAVRGQPSVRVDRKLMERGARVTLGERRLGAEGWWRYVTEVDAPHRSGWVLESDLEDFRPPER